MILVLIGPHRWLVTSWRSTEEEIECTDRGMFALFAKHVGTIRVSRERQREREKWVILNHIYYIVQHAILQCYSLQWTNELNENAQIKEFHSSPWGKSSCKMYTFDYLHYHHHWPLDHYCPHPPFLPWLPKWIESFTQKQTLQTFEHYRTWQRTNKSWGQ